MTDEEIEQGLQAMLLHLNWGTVERANAVDTAGKGDNQYGGMPKDIAIIHATLDYINRLKEDRNYWKLQFEWQAEQDKNALMGVRQIRNDTAKKIFKTILDDYQGVDYYSFLFDGLQAIADDMYGIRIMQSENGVSVEVDDE